MTVGGDWIAHTASAWADILQKYGGREEDREITEGC